MDSYAKSDFWKPLNAQELWTLQKRLKAEEYCKNPNNNSNWKQGCSHKFHICVAWNPLVQKKLTSGSRRRWWQGRISTQKRNLAKGKKPPRQKYLMSFFIIITASCLGTGVYQRKKWNISQTGATAGGGKSHMFVLIYTLPDDRLIRTGVLCAYLEDLDPSSLWMEWYSRELKRGCNDNSSIAKDCRHFNGPTHLPSEPFWAVMSMAACWHHHPEWLQ